MGDRANIYLIDNLEGRGIYLYTHWNGYEWPERLRQALIFGKDRWNDEAYLNRIIITQIFKDLESTTGGGVSTFLGDGSNRILNCDTARSLVWVNSDDKWSFEEYVKLDRAEWKKI